MKVNKLWIIIICLVLTISLNVNIVKANTPTDRIKEANKVITEISDQVDIESLTHLLKQANGIVIFPKVIKGGFMLGGRYGKGLLLKHNPVNGHWYGPYFIELKRLSYGFQVGAESINLILVITNERGLNNFKEDNLTIGGGASIAAG